MGARVCAAVGVGLVAIAAGASAAEFHRLLAQDMGMDSSTMMGTDGNGTMVGDMSDEIPVTMPNPDIIDPLPVMPENTTEDDGPARIISNSTDEDGNTQYTVAIPGGGTFEMSISETTVTIPGFPGFTIPGFAFPGTPDYTIPAIEVLGSQFEGFMDSDP